MNDYPASGARKPTAQLNRAAFAMTAEQQQAEHYQSIRPMTKAAADVRAALAEVGVRPFNSDDVEQYKSAEVNKIRKSSVLPFMASVVVVGGCMYAMVVTDHFGWAVPMILALLVAIPSFFSGICDAWGQRWVKHALADYPSEVPQYALDTALAIREVLPEAKFYVEALEESKDPFLVLSHGQEDLYLEVWDEPDFGTKRTV